MTKDEALRLALEALEKLWNIIDDIDTYSDMAKADEKLYRSLVERRQRQRFEETGISTDGYELHGGAITAIKAALEAKDEPADNELRRLHDLLGKANALARIRAAEIESLKASLYGHYELEKQYDELKQRLTKTEGQLGEAVWNYGELKREQLANQQNTSGSPIFLELHCICGAEWEWRNRDWELVATPPQRKPLTDEEIYTEARNHEKFAKDGREWFDRGSFARAIEAAHGIKGEA